MPVAPKPPRLVPLVPQLSTVLYSWDPAAGIARISTRADRAKARNVAADAHTALFVEGPDQWSFVVAEGEAELSAVSTTPGDATGVELLGLFPQPDPTAEAAFFEGRGAVPFGFGGRRTAVVLIG